MTTRPVADRLGDFTADARILTITLLAVVIGVFSAFVALGLVRLIGFFTHVFYYHEIAGTLVSPAANRLGVRPGVSPLHRRAQDGARGRRGGWHGGRVRDAGGGGVACRRADAVRMEAA